MSNLLKQLTDHAVELHKTAEMDKTAEEIFADAVRDELESLGYGEIAKTAGFGKAVTWARKLLPGAKKVVSKSQAAISGGRARILDKSKKGLFGGIPGSK